MTEYNKNNKKLIKIIIMILIIFSIFWLGMNLQVVFNVIDIKNDDINDFITYKYHNCIKMLGMIVPVIYGLVFYYIFILENDYIIIRYGRMKYEKRETKKIFLFSILFALEYMGVDLIFTTIFVRLNVLLETGYYLLIFLKCVMLIFYLNLIGETLLFIKNLLKFSPVYVIVGITFYVVLAIIYYVTLEEISPVFYMDFSEEWFLYKRFDSLSYIINIAKLFFSSLILMYLGVFIFLKRDIIENEEI